MKSRKELNNIRARRAKRARGGISGTAEKPRLAVFRSNRNLFAQLIDDVKGHTLASASTKTAVKGPKAVQAGEVGSAIAKKALEKGIKEAVFDRRSYKYHGRVAAVAEGARKGGLKL